MVGALRGLAALGVALFHIVRSPIGFETNAFTRSIFVHGAHGVQLFFVISGVVIPLSLLRKKYQISNFGRFMLKRTIRIEPTYIIFIVITLVWIFVRGIVMKDDGVPFPSLQNIFYNIFYLVPFLPGEDWINPVFWTLGIELQFYVLCALFFGVFKSFDSMGGLLVLSVISGALMLFFPNGYIFEWIGFFVVGFFIALWIHKSLTNERLALLLIFQILFIALDKGYYFALIAALAAILLVLNPHGGKSKLLQFLGNQSYSLYLTHSLVGTTLVNLAMRFVSHTHPLIHWIIIITAVIFSMGSAQLLYRFVEKPTLEKSKKIRL